MKEVVKSKITQVEVAVNDLEGAFIAADVVDMSTGEVLIDANHELDLYRGQRKLIDAGITSFEVFFPSERDEVGTVGHFHHSQKGSGQDPQRSVDPEIYRKLRPGDPPTVDTATQLFEGTCSSTRASTISRAWAA